MLQLLALMVAMLLVGAPAMVAELAEDDCAEECVGDSGPSCPEEGCNDCSPVCSSCPRTHVVAAALTAWSSPAADVVVGAPVEGCQRVPTGPPPEGVFHPPRVAA